MANLYCAEQINKVTQTVEVLVFKSPPWRVCWHHIETFWLRVSLLYWPGCLLLLLVVAQVQWQHGQASTQC